MAVDIGPARWIDENRKLHSEIISLRSERDRLLKALAERDASYKTCPFTRTPTPDHAKPCPKCGATAREVCGVQAGADYRFASAARYALNPPPPAAPAAPTASTDPGFVGAGKDLS